MNVRDLLLRARALFFRPRVEVELDEELQSHIELQTRKHVAAGLSLEEARSRARREFGAVELAKEECRDSRRVRLLEDLWHDLLYAFRIFRGSPVLAFTAL